MRSDSMQIRNAGAPQLIDVETSGVRDRTLRRLLIFLAMIVEAGLPFFPRVPLTGGLFVLSGVAVLMRGGLDRRVLFLFVLPVIVMIEMATLQPYPTIESIISRFVNFSSAIFLVNLYLGEEHNCLAEDMKPILRFMALQGLATFALANSMPDLFTTIATEIWSYNTIGFIFTYHMTPTDFIAKADGFFFERGVFQIFLNLYVYFSLFTYKSKKDVILAMLGVISTWSTAGIFVMITIIAFSILAGEGRSSRTSRIRTFLLVIVLLLPIGNLAYFNVQSKFFGNEVSSVNARQFDFAAGSQIIMENPIFGIGFSNIAFAEVFQTKSNLVLDGEYLVERSLSNGILRLFICVGIPVGLVFLYGMFNSTLTDNPRVIGVLLFLALLSQAIIFCPFILMLIFSGLVSRPKPKKIQPYRALPITNKRVYI